MSLETTWLLGWNDPSGTDGRPWGTGTQVALRAQHNRPPWDAGCQVEPLIGGYATMNAIREALKVTIAAAGQAAAAGAAIGERGLVYLADWRINALRDLSDGNWWGTDSWATATKPNTTVPPGQTWPPAAHDETVIGLLLRLIAAGVTVRVLAWAPYRQEAMADLSLLPELIWMARVVQWANKSQADGATHADQAVVPDLAVVGLDSRVADHPAAAHHQKMCVIRPADGQNVDPVAFCGGVDLSWTRRDAPVKNASGTTPSFGSGDWQSGGGIPQIRGDWPRGPLIDFAAQPVINAAVPTVDTPGSSWDSGSDLETGVYGDGLKHRQIWHDQHLRLHGPIVATLQDQFAERWNDAGRVRLLPDPGSGPRWTAAPDVLYVSSQTSPLSVPAAPVPAPSDGTGTASVQMWRTIPLRRRRPADATFADGEFTVMRGYANAVMQATNLIWIFDQYFWSVPYARLLNQRLKQCPTLGVVVVLPPHADTPAGLVADTQHAARYATTQALLAGVDPARVAVWDLWDYRSGSGGSGAGTWGIYVHAKAHTYDGTLMVCGSANINRRSLTGDSELVCAVVDRPTVQQHMKNLWSLLFPKVTWPTVDVSVPAASAATSPGLEFVRKFTAAAKQSINGSGFLTQDPTVVSADDVKLPNGFTWHYWHWFIPAEGYLQNFVVHDYVIESTSLSLAAEQSPVGGNPPTLLDVSNRVEGLAGFSRQQWRTQ